MASPPTSPTFSQAFADVLADAMSKMDDQTTEEPATSSTDDDPQKNPAIVLMKVKDTEFMAYIFPVVPSEPIAVTRVFGLPRESNEDMAIEERWQRMHYLGQKETRAEALILAAMFIDDEDKIRMMPTVASLMKGQSGT